jgi:GNAT superfamily N-acetyltransferase
MLRKALMEDANAIMKMIEQARLLLALHHSGQWQGKEPSMETILNDIKLQQYWVLEENLSICAGAALLPWDEDYQVLHEGQWLNEEPYRVLHRFVVASTKLRQGLGKQLIQQLEQVTMSQGVYNIKVDTHVRNVPMVRLLNQLGYIRCGVVILKGHLIREAFQKRLRSRI